MNMINSSIKLILILLIIFTPIAFGSMELWAFSMMELGILSMIILWAIQSLILRTPNLSGRQANSNLHTSNPESKTFNSQPNTLNSPLTIFLLSFFLLLILFQLLPLPSGLLKILSPKTYALHQSLSISNFEPSALSFRLSFVPFVTQIQFFKWLTLIGLFLFLLYWGPFGNSNRMIQPFIIVIMALGIWESLYGIFEFFSGHGQILNLEGEGLVSSVTGTFINRNYFAGYLLMVIPLNVGYLLSRQAREIGLYRGWRHRLSSLDGKTLLIGFGAIVMMIALIFSASRMGITSLLLSFSLLIFLFRDPIGEKRFSKTSVLIFTLALLWAIWIGLDAVVSRFFTTTEDFKLKWTIWANTFQIFKDFPLLGSGLGTFVYIFPMYRTLHIEGLATHAENDILQLASEVGSIGLGLLSVLFFYLFYKTISGIRSISHREPERYTGIGSLVGILALMFHSLVERNIQVPANAFLYTLLWAIVLRISTRGVNRRNDPINAISSANAKQ
jgi:putative inorganic carbon (hco3(-)) transporter